MPALLEERPVEGTAVNPFADLMGGENGGPAYQNVAGRFGEVPKAEIAAPTELGAFADLVPQSPVAETEKAFAEAPFLEEDRAGARARAGAPEAGADTGFIHQTLNAVRVFGNAAGKYIFRGLEGLEHETAKTLANPPSELIRPEAEAVLLPKAQQDALEAQYIAEAQAAVPAAQAREAYFKARVAGADKQSEIDPALAKTIPARLADAAGEATMMGIESLVPGAGLPLMVFHGALATEAEALNAGKTEQEAEGAAVRSAIGLGLFGGASKVAALGVAKLLPRAVSDPSKLTRFMAQFVGQDASNEASSRAIGAWNAASAAPEGKKVTAAMDALGGWNLESGTLNTVYALMHAAKAAGAPPKAERGTRNAEAPVSPASEPVVEPAVTEGMATETQRYAEPAREAGPGNEAADVMQPVEATKGGEPTDALQKRSATPEVSRTVEAGKDRPEDSAGVRPGEQGTETAGAVAQEEERPVISPERELLNRIAPAQESRGTEVLSASGENIAPETAKVETPTKAIAKAQEHLDDLRQRLKSPEPWMEYARSKNPFEPHPADVKGELIARLQAAHEAAPSEANLPNAVSIASNRKRGSDMSNSDVADALKKSGIEKIVVNIPGDGEFHVWNTKEAIEPVLKRARSLKTGAEHSAPSARHVGKGATDIDRLVDDALAVTRTPRQAIDFLRKNMEGMPAKFTERQVHERAVAQIEQQFSLKPASLRERAKAALANANETIRDVVADSRKTGLVPAGSTGIQGGIEHLGKIWRQIRELPKFGDFKRAILGFGQKMQSSFLEAKEIGRTLRKSVPSRIAREGIFNFIEAGGDKSKLTIWRDASPEPDLKRGYEAALNLTPEQETIAGHLADFYSNKLGEGQAAGILAEGRENYVNRIVDKRRSKGFAPVTAGGSGVGPGTSGRLSKNFRHGLHRVFENSFDAERNGIRYKTKDVAELAPIYLNEMNKTIGTRNLLADLAHGTAEDGRALAYPKGQMTTLTDAEGATTSRLIKPNAKQMVRDEITGQDVSSQDYASVDHPALTGWKWVGADENGKPILVQGNLALHPEIAGHVKNLLGQSALRRWYNSDGSPLASIPKALVRNIDKAQQVAKELLFSGSGFHHANLGFHAVEHRVNPVPEFFKSLSRNYTIDPRDPKVQDWMQHSLQLAPDQLSARQFMEGFSGRAVEKIPIYGRVAGAIADHLFERFIPALKLRLADSMLKRNLKLYAGDMAANKVTPAQVKYLSAQQANSALSHLNYIDMGRNPTLRHLISLVTLAPDFTESRARFLAQAGKTLLGSKAGVEQFVALAYGAGLIWGMARVLNKVGDGDYHFEESFGVVHKGRVYSIRSIQGDVAHMLMDTRKFVYGRISPLAKLLTEQFITGTNYRGEKIGHLESLKEYLANYVPISAKNVPGLRDLFETTRNNPVTPWESFMGAMGIQASRYSPITKVYGLARDYQKSQGVEPDKGVYPVSKYSPLRYALEDGDLDRARGEYEKLIDAGEKRGKIGGGFRESVLHPFTGSEASDRKFKLSLQGDDRALYEAAVKKRHEILKRYQAMRAGR